MNGYKIVNTITNRDLAVQSSKGSIDDEPMFFRTKAGAIMYIKKYNLSHFYQVKEHFSSRATEDIIY